MVRAAAGGGGRSADVVEDLVGGFGPSNGVLRFVMRVDVREDGRAELGNARVGSALERLLVSSPKKRSTRFATGIGGVK